MRALTKFVNYFFDIFIILIKYVEEDQAVV